MSEANQISRRGVLCGLAVLALGIVPETAIAATGVKVLANGKVEVPIARNPALRKVGGVIEFQDGSGNTIALIRTTTKVNGFSALNLACTHENIIVEREGNGWRCRDGHRAKFSLTGAVEQGPANLPLRSVATKATKTKVTIG